MNSPPMPAPRRTRLKKLVQPRLQLKLSLWFVCVVATALVTQFVFLARAISQISLQPSGDPSVYFDRFVSEAVGILAISLGVVLPLTLLVGVLATFRIAGPIHRMRAFLAAVQRGEHPPDIRLRKDDELQDLAAALNDVTRRLRAQDVRAGDASERTAA